MLETLLFGLFAAACWTIEHRALPGGPGTSSSRRKRRRAGTNLLVALSVIPVQAVMTFVCMAAAAWATTQHCGLIHLSPALQHPLIKYGLMFVLLDFLDYVYHYAMHHIPVLWRFHLVHHTDQAVDTSTTVREHPGETLVRNAFLLAWILLTGASLEILIIRQTAETIANILAHTTFRLPPGPARILGWLLITPNLHHVHHHHRLPYTDRNYGDVFSVWDRLFGTFATLAASEIVFGLDTHTNRTGDHGIIRSLSLPFDDLKHPELAA